MATVFINAKLPDSLVQAFLQHIRDFDVRYPGCHFAIGANAEAMAVDDMVAAIQSIYPHFKFLHVIPSNED